ncbi:hypothetical protein OAK75_14095 [Bacteriovoracales bacterium]|nr:hypothetical protein [Bacteriovoracales bacterium]
MKVPYLNAGYRDGVGVVGPLTLHGKTSCYECFKPGPNEKNNLNPTNNNLDNIKERFYKRYQAPSFGPVNAIVSNIAVLETIKFLGGFGKVNSMDKEIIIDAIDLELQFKEYQRDPECWHCSDKS